MIFSGRRSMKQERTHQPNLFAWVVQQHLDTEHPPSLVPFLTENCPILETRSF